MLNIYIFYLLLTILKLNFVITEDICSRYACKVNEINYSVKQKSLVPDLQNGNKSILLFDYNAILHLYKFSKLKVSHLSNYITTIDDSAFINLYDLSSLDLSNNLLTSNSLTPNVFKVNI